MNLDEINYDELLKKKPYDGDLVFNVNGMTADEYISTITEEMNAIDLSSVPIDKWDIVVTFALAVLEVAGDFFIGDPNFKYSLANKNGPFCEWLDKFHEKASRTGKWWGHKRSPLDYQGKGYGGGDHRAKSIIHGSPFLRAEKALYDKGKDNKDEKGIAEKTVDWTMLAHDLITFSLAIYSISSGKFIDFRKFPEGEQSLMKRCFLVVSPTNQKGNSYDSCDVITAFVKYAVHMFADFFSKMSLPLPGFSLLTRVKDSDVEKFALKLYNEGMNMRTLVLQGIPVGVTELLMSLYVWTRAKDAEEGMSEASWNHKKKKLLLISHGISTAVNVGKVIITEAPWRLNLVVIARTFQLIWQVAKEEARLTNRHIEKRDLGILTARIESSKTLVLLDKATYETENVDRMLQTLSERMTDTTDKIDSTLSEVDSEFKAMLKEIGD